MHLPCIGAVFGGAAIELAGRAIHPEYQANGIGAYMLHSYLTQHQDVTQLATYTRNPSILRMIRTVAHTIYPINDDKQLEKIAQQMPHAQQPQNDVVYHLDRYGPKGLFGHSDPADRPYFRNGIPLKKMYRNLQSVQSALIVTARIVPHLVQTHAQRAADITKLAYNGEQHE